MAWSSIGRRSVIVGALSGVAAAAHAPAWAADPIKIGFSIAQTGGLAAIGKQTLLTMQIWAEDVNAKGGLLGRPVQLIAYDDQSNPANVPPIYTKLLDVDKVDLVVTNGTNLTVPAMPIAMQHDKVVLTMLAFFLNDTATTELYTLSLHDALPILIGSTAALTLLLLAGISFSTRYRAVHQS